MNSLNIRFERNCKILHCSLVFYKKCCIVLNIGNENKQMWFASNREVRRMIEIQALLVILQLFFVGLVALTIIAFALIIALVVIISKQK